ncbi:hypothetical protein WA026_015107 [Henosepilachna vigintioctopunctata]|uniref:Uncharacterized protein n=1 Tax=Henosepilachna vigintioctopunctata TaxID=420089 RepID=A0AAW1TVW2_9CUCU
MEKALLIEEMESRKNCLEKDRQCDEQIRHNVEHNVRVSVANKMIKFYQIQDKLFLQKKMQKSLDKKKNYAHKPQAKYEVNRDPTRLFKPTQQWMNRFLASNENVSMKPVTFINNVPKLQIPAWRKNA